MRIKILLILLSFCFTACSTMWAKNYPSLNVVSNINIDRYLGKWFEIARYPNWFQEGCYSVTANYELNDDGSIKVINRCSEGGKSGDLREAIGVAHVVDKSTNAKLKVSFFRPFYGNYWIIDVGDDYEYAVVSEPSRKYLWILSRTKTMDSVLYHHIIERLKLKGLEVNQLKITVQD